MFLQKLENWKFMELYNNLEKNLRKTFLDFFQYM